MNPVIGLDVSKGQSHGQVFLDKSQPYGKSFSFLHTQEGLHYFLNLINDITKLTGHSPTIILESTGRYQAAVVQFLEGYLVCASLVYHRVLRNLEINIDKILAGFS